MKLLITGANGQVGWELSRSLMPLGQVVSLGRDRFDLAHPERLPSVVRDVRPDVIVNAAAYTAVDKAEDEEDLALAVNGKSVGVLAEEASRLGALLIHYSTDYVFDGKKSAPYTETDVPSPINAYGRSKLAGEIAVHQAAEAYLILRTSWVYAARGRNFVRTILRLAREREELHVVSDQVGAPTWARDIAMATARVIEGAIGERRRGQFASGLFHMTASGTASWHEFAEAILEQGSSCGLLPSSRSRPRLEAISSDQYRVAAARPKNSCLAGDRLAQRFGIALPDWKVALPQCVKEIES